MDGMAHGKGIFYSKTVPQLACIGGQWKQGTFEEEII